MTIRSVCRVAYICAAVFGAIFWQGAVAQQPQPQPETPVSQEERIASERSAAFEAAGKVVKHGPEVVPLGEQGNIAVPKKYMFIPQPEAGRLMRALGNNPSPQLFGLLWPEEEPQSWFATIIFVKSGYVRDQDAKNWDVAELLQNLKDGTEAFNKERVARGFPALEVDGWVERPDYDPVNHRLVWSVNARHRGTPVSDQDTVNYNTYVLGREGYFSLNFVTDMQSIGAQKPIARELLSAMSFVPGKSYADYNSITDHAAEFGIGALIAGGAAKKLGLFAVIGVFLAKAGKLLLIPLIAGGALLRKLFSRNRDSA